MKDLQKKALKALKEVAKKVQSSGRPYSIMKDGKVVRVVSPKNSYKFFQNKSCRFYPCHKGIAKREFSCSFCFCPIFPQREVNAVCLVCGPCEKCTFPHKAKNYKKIIEMLK
jgi:Zn-finger protein